MSDNHAYTFFKLGLVRPAMHLLWHPLVEGEQNIPASGGAILASNHISAVDTLITPGMIKRRVTYPAKAELFHMPGVKGAVVGWFLRTVGQVPMDRSGGRASADGLGPITAALEGGDLVGIYPEGTRSPDGRLYKGRTGVARLALSTGAPVVPVGVIGSELEKGPLGLPVADRPVVRFGRPLDFSAYRGQLTGETMRWVTDEVMNAIMQLTGQTYVDTYGSNLKVGALRGKDTSHLVKARPGGGPAPVLRPQGDETAS